MSGQKSDQSSSTDAITSKGFIENPDIAHVLTEIINVKGAIDDAGDASVSRLQSIAASLQSIDDSLRQIVRHLGQGDVRSTRRAR